ncbi:MAG: aspartyl-phosphate phosphatase Spo0E family protein [Peptococcaceae bacterium]|nr:aspartyl-phosphate phosphatase Spo0E family protein [Peptococcaceae bacterium]
MKSSHYQKKRKLLEEIETMRRRLEIMYLHQGDFSTDVLVFSQELDEKILEFMSHQKSCCRDFPPVR